MEEFQRTLLEDIHDRIDELKARLTASALDPDRCRLAIPATRSLDQMGRMVDQLIHDPRLSDPRFDQEHRLMLERINENISIVESVVVPLLERFNLSDRRLTRLTAKLIEQVNFPLAAPIVSTSAEGGYMTFPGFAVVKVPAVEDTSLLALPDLVHELGHILLLKERPKLVGDFVKVVADYVSEQQTAAGQTPLSPHLFEQWRGPWLQELVCDMIAAYVCGPSFGEQHIRLISGLPSRAFRGGQTHPPDEARARGASFVLRTMGHEQKADALIDLIARYLPTTGERRPKDYDRTMPDQLLEALAQRVVAGCSQLGIRRFDAPEVSRPEDIVGAITEAWQRFRTAPAGFAAWQRGRLGLLWRQLGLGPEAPRQTRHLPRQPGPVRSSAAPEIAA